MGSSHRFGGILGLIALLWVLARLAMPYVEAWLGGWAGDTQPPSYFSILHLAAVALWSLLSFATGYLVYYLVCVAGEVVLNQPVTGRPPQARRLGFLFLLATLLWIETALVFAVFSVWAIERKSFFLLGFFSCLF